MRLSNIRYVAVAALAAFAFAACSSSSKTPAADTTPSTAATTTTAGSSSSTPTGGPKTVSLVTDPKFGKIMADSKGLILYVDEKDKPGKPACTGACLSIWPPVPAPASPTFGPGLTPSKFTTVTASDGTKQLAVNGSPLYTFVGKAAGDSSGQGVNGFYTVMANGVKYDPGP
jgi:predicted lipoprotein with Yx(FWY)xxD motif